MQHKDKMKKIKFNAAFAGLMLAGAAFCALPSCANSARQEAIEDTAVEAAEETADVTTATADPQSMDAFATATKGKEVKTTQSGLRYAILEEGDGASPSASDEVTVLYTGMLPDGTVFDSTDKHGGEPISFPLANVISGWTEGLQLMKTGGEAVFYIPAELAYGPQGIPGVIPGNSPLIFTVKLIGINK